MHVCLFCYKLLIFCPITVLVNCTSPTNIQYVGEKCKAALEPPQAGPSPMVAALTAAAPTITAAAPIITPTITAATPIITPTIMPTITVAAVPSRTVGSP